jgi:hypothetical protein
VIRACSRSPTGCWWAGRWRSRSSRRAAARRRLAGRGRPARAGVASWSTRPSSSGRRAAAAHDACAPRDRGGRRDRRAPVDAIPDGSSSGSTSAPPPSPLRAPRSSTRPACSGTGRWASSRCRRSTRAPARWPSGGRLERDDRRRRRRLGRRRQRPGPGRPHRSHLDRAAAPRSSCSRAGRCPAWLPSAASRGPDARRALLLPLRAPSRLVPAAWGFDPERPVLANLDGDYGYLERGLLPLARPRGRWRTGGADHGRGARRLRGADRAGQRRSEHGLTVPSFEVVTDRFPPPPLMAYPINPFSSRGERLEDRDAIEAHRRGLTYTGKYAVCASGCPRAAASTRCGWSSDTRA